MGNAYSLVIGANNSTLRTKAKPIDRITKDVVSFSKILLDKMYEYGGVGLAAPQIGILRRVIAVTFRKEKQGKDTMTGDGVMINPEIIRKSEEKYVFEEACLSLPGESGNVLRHRHIKVQYKTPEGKIQTKKLSNMSAVIAQHEIDHLDGILFIDKILEK